MIVACITLLVGLGAPLIVAGLSALAISMSVIAVHGILSGTATADFGGRKNVGKVVGIVDGFVYLGTALQSIVIGALAPDGAASSDPSAWRAWPLFLIPFAVLGFVLTLKIWHALPASARKDTPKPDTGAEAVS